MASMGKIVLYSGVRMITAGTIRLVHLLIKLYVNQSMSSSSLYFKTNLFLFFQQINTKDE